MNSWCDQRTSSRGWEMQVSHRLPVCEVHWPGTIQFIERRPFDPWNLVDESNDLFTAANTHCCSKKTSRCSSQYTTHCMRVSNRQKAHEDRSRDWLLLAPTTITTAVAPFTLRRPSWSLFSPIFSLIILSLSLSLSCSNLNQNMASSFWLSFGQRIKFLTRESDVCTKNRLSGKRTDNCFQCPPKNVYCLFKMQWPKFRI